MNINRLKYFMVAAETLNFTTAAEFLYVTQPALSKQISALEGELNAQLFIREKSGVRLTPAGEVLANNVESILDNYDKVMGEVREANRGMNLSLEVGTLEGQILDDAFLKAFRSLHLNHPNISVRLVHHSFGKLREKLLSGDLDAILTLSFDIEGLANLKTLNIRACPNHLVVSNAVYNPKDFKGFSDLEKIKFITPKDTLSGQNKFITECKENGIYPDLLHAPNLSTVMLWIEAGIGTGIVNAQSMILKNDEIGILDAISLEDAQTQLAWSDSNSNPALSMFIKLVEDFL